MNLINLRDLTVEERYTALRALGQRWTDLLIDLSTGTRPLGHDTDVAVLASAVAPLCHSLLTLDRIADLMYGLNAAITHFDTYESFGTWPDEYDESMSARTEEERADYLDTDVSWWLFPLVHGTEPCADCTKYRELSEWQPKQGLGLRCTEHAKAHLAERERLFPGIDRMPRRTSEPISKFFDNPAATSASMRYTGRWL